MKSQWCFLVSYTDLHKTPSRQSRDLKLGGVIAYAQFQKVYHFKSQQHEMTS